MIEWNLQPRSNLQHELGGAIPYAITRDGYLKVKPTKVFGERPVPNDLLNESAKPKIIEFEV